MPYIDQNSRHVLKQYIENLENVLALGGHKPGNLNYVITKLVLAHWNHDQCYATIAHITGVLNDVKTEFERQVVAKYEDEKIEQNGPIYEEGGV